MMIVNPNLQKGVLFKNIKKIKIRVGYGCRLILTCKSFIIHVFLILYFIFFRSWYVDRVLTKHQEITNSFEFNNPDCYRRRRPLCCCDSLFRQSASQVVFCAYEIFLIILKISFKPKLLKCNLTFFAVNDLIVTLNLLVLFKGTYFHKSVIKRVVNPKE